MPHETRDKGRMGRDGGRGGRTGRTGKDGDGRNKAEEAVRVSGLNVRREPRGEWGGEGGHDQGGEAITVGGLYVNAEANERLRCLQVPARRRTHECRLPL